MAYLQAALLGLAAGSIGVTLWAIITIATKHEFGALAVGIGIAVGLSVRLGAGEDTGAVFGALASVISASAFLAGKYAVYELPYRMAIRKVKAWEPTVSREILVCELAEKIVAERNATTTSIPRGEGKKPPTPACLEDYPAAVALEAAARWDALPESEREKQRQAMKLLMKQTSFAVVEFGKHDGFRQRFSLLDLAWVAISGAAAFVLAAG